MGQQTEKAQTQASPGFSVSESVRGVSAFEGTFSPSIKSRRFGKQEASFKSTGEDNQPLSGCRLGPQEHKLQPVICQLKGTKKRLTQRSVYRSFFNSE